MGEVIEIRGRMFKAGPQSRPPGSHQKQQTKEVNLDHPLLPTLFSIEQEKSPHVLSQGFPRLRLQSQHSILTPHELESKKNEHLLLNVLSKESPLKSHLLSHQLPSSRPRRIGKEASFVKRRVLFVIFLSPQRPGK
ncbi:hypothetical protein AMTR_s00014p00093810 [Amborella trichopoda]|uniref:Uncharacterized protein n=1 Tax=Amborella trichopoda TaxID=13333 RepID=W1PN15_AMBTC|nr:hypothetical protein AMTR_s00014p00093810 [Amborella trichopoda]